MKTLTYTKCPWSPPSLNTTEYEENARLIAAAPEMLEALQRITHPMASEEDLQNALAVIAKVKGGDE